MTKPVIPLKTLPDYEEAKALHDEQLEQIIYRLSIVSKQLIRCSEKARTRCSTRVLDDLNTALSCVGYAKRSVMRQLDL